MEELISELLEKGIFLSKVGDKLNVEFNGDAISDELLDKIRSNKEHLLNYLVDKDSQTTYREIQQLDKADCYDLSSAQKRIWVLCQFEEVSKVYNMPNSIFLTGDYNIENFKKAIHATVERHEILRTIFKTDGTGEIKQWVISKDEFPFEIEAIDYSNRPKEEVESFLSNDSYKPFDLEKGPLLRATLIKLADQEYIFYNNMHHIISDGWSKDIMSRDVLAFYEAFQGDTNAQLSDLKIQYKDYSAWQQSQLKNGDFDDARAFWLNSLSGTLPVFSLPSTKERPRVRTYSGQSLTTFISDTTTEKLRNYSVGKGGSLFMGLLAAWNVLKYHYSGQEDLIIGSVVAGRDHAELEDQIGYYLNTLALRNQVNPQETFDQFFETVVQNTYDAFSHQSYPFDRLVEELEITRDESRSAVFDVIFALQNTARETENYSVSEEDVVQIRSNGTVLEKFDMTVLFKEIGNYLSFELNYNSDIYDQELMEGLMRHFKSLVDALMSAPDEKMGELDFLGEEEKVQLIEEKNQSTVSDSSEDTILDVFQRQVQLTPHSTALVFGDVSMTYAELNTRTDELARCLIEEYKIEENDQIGVFMDRSEWLLIAMLATLKAGGTYVPIDTKTTLERQEFIISDIQPKLLLILSENMFDILEFDIEAFSVDIQLSDWVAENSTLTSELKRVSPSQTAYVIYTSGSTGAPKGVEVTHGNVYNYLSWAKNTYVDEQDAQNHFGLYSSPSFDLTVTSLFLPLISGSTIRIYPPEMEISEMLRDYFDPSTPADIIKLTPAHVQVLEHLDLKSTNVKTAILGGEELLPHHVRILKELNPDMRIFNEYGPTECTVGCTAYEVENDQRITIGKPIANTQAYIVNEFGKLQPEGVVGELIIGGRGIAKGYLNQQDQTNERFISPYFLNKESRVYRTGDLARWLPNGDLAYFGRNDDQVKIRGHRVELGEISNKIVSNDCVESAALKVFNEDDENKTLVAYYVPELKTAYTLNQSLKHAKGQLPERMKLHELPNGMLMYAYNKTELHFVFEEIFEHDVYLKHGIQIPDNGCVFDVGANDGMFSLYAHLAANQVKIHAFEPLPPTFELLKHNTELYEGDYTVHKIGLARKEETATFSYFPNATVLSTRYQEGNEIESIVKKFIKNANETADEKLKDEQLDTLLDDRLKSEEYTCKLKRLSQIIAEENIEKIDLLKVDVEKSELDVLEGIDPDDWKRIQQIVIEVHDDENDRLSHIKGMLEDHGYHVIVHQSDDAQGTNLYDLYARKRELVESQTNQEQQKIRAVECKSKQQIEKEIRGSLENKLPDYMIPNHFVAMASIPLTKNGKIDKDQLENPSSDTGTTEVNYVAPESQLEKNVVAIWENVLQKERVGLEDDFFILGGHSLKAIRLINEYQKSFDVKLSINDLFTNTTVKSHVNLVQSSTKENYAEIEAFSDEQLEKGSKHGFAISDAQRRLWILSQFEESSVAYNVSGTIQLIDSTELNTLKKAIRAVVDRHEILRTVFRTSEQDGDDSGEVRQWVIPTEEFDHSIDYQDFTHSSSDAYAYVERDSLTPFDLENGPLIRMAILKLKEDEFLLYYNMHHIISDGWSMEVLIKDTMALYKEFHQGIDAELKPLSIQYKEYAAWKLEQIENGSFDKHQRYWLENLSGELPLIDLSRVKKRPRIKTYNGHTLGMFLSKEVTKKLNSYAVENGGTLFMTLLSSLNAVLSRYTSQNDIIVGSPVAGRSHADLENQIGFYVNTLALRNEVNSADSFNDLFARIKDTTLEAYQYQEYPFDRLVDELNLPVDTGRHPVFDIMLVLQNNRENDSKFSLQNQEKKEIFDIGTQTSKFDLLIAAEERGEHIALSFEYNTDVYERATIERFALHFNALIEGLINAPLKPLNEINYLSDDELNRLTNSLNDTKVVYSGSTVMSLFEEQVSSTPDATAVVFNGESLTYDELNQWSNGLANALRNDFGVTAPSEAGILTQTTTVGVVLERSLESVVAMIGVMKSGACYVPIDHDYPTERVQYMAQDAGFGILVGDQELAEKNGISIESLVSVGNYDPRSNDTVDTQNVEVDLLPDDWAAIYYTSGSTGKPKGVIQTHRMIRNLTQWDMHHSGLGNGVRHLQYTSFGFDASIHDVYSVLCRAGSLYLVSEDHLLDYPALLKEIGQYQIETMFMPFSALNAFLMQVELDKIESHSLKHIISTAEQLYVSEQMENFLEQNPEVKLHNRYGPSETHVVTSCWMSASEGNIIHRPSIGKPISNTQIYILDEHENLLPEGLTGEICIAGENVGGGYLNLPEITKEKFKDNPFEEMGRMYKTGDLGYWAPDGNIELIGRVDDQVKIRGYRIELNEITRELLAHKSIDNGLVTTFTNDREQKELVAYFTLSNEGKANNIEGNEASVIEELRALLKSKLPAYMVPSYFVELDEMPLTPNGKIDEKGLPLPDGTSRAKDSEYLAARNELEAKMTTIWEDVLQQDRIGIKDDFFMLGGHSLKAVRIRNRYQKELNVSLSLKELFTNSTIESQSELIENTIRKEFEAIPKAEIRAIYPVSEGQKRLWILSQLDAASTAYSISNTIQLSGTYDKARLQKAVDKSVERHEILRTVFTTNAQGNLGQQILSSDKIDFNVDFIDVHEELNKRELVQKYIQSDMNKVFDLEKGPLFRASLIQVEEEEYLLYFNMHHIICDDWSIRALFKDTMFFYEQLEKGIDEDLEPLRIHYKDYSVWQQDELSNVRSNVHKDFWLNKLSGELPVMDLPFTKERPTFRSFEGGIWATEIHPEHIIELRTQSQKKGGTLFHGLLAAWLVLMHKYTTENDLLIGTSVAGRNHADLEHQIGYYSNSIALRNTLVPTDSFEQILKNIIESSTEAMNHQDYPFNRLVEELGAKRESNRNPVFDSMFVYNTGDQPSQTETRQNFDEVHHSESKAKLDLEISILDMGSILSFRIIYDADVFESIHIKNMLLRFKLLVKELVTDSTKSIKEFSIDGASRKEKKKKNLSKLMSKK
ncbi:MAG: amino acid adenylation domain-containing protein [Crocinitomicaceae bacterium]